MKFYNASPTMSYDVIDGQSGTWLTCGISGTEVMIEDWPDGAELYIEGTNLDTPLEIAS